VFYTHPVADIIGSTYYISGSWLPSRIEFSRLKTPVCFGVSENFSHFQFGTISEVTVTVLVNTGQYKPFIKLNFSD
jgi:hypothetical protein